MGIVLQSRHALNKTLLSLDTLGDKIIEWDGESLVDRTFEEVCAIMDRSGFEVTLVVEHVVEG